MLFFFNKLFVLRRLETENLAQFHCNMHDDALVQWISNFAPPCRVRDLHFYKEATNIFVTATKKGFLSTTGKRKTRKITSFSRLLRLLLLHLPSLRFPRKIHSSYSATTGLRLSVVVRGKGGSKKSRMLTGRPAGYKWNVIL